MYNILLVENPQRTENETEKKKQPKQQHKNHNEALGIAINVARADKIRCESPIRRSYLIITAFSSNYITMYTTISIWAQLYTTVAAYL